MSIEHISCGKGFVSEWMDNELAVKTWSVHMYIPACLLDEGIVLWDIIKDRMGLLCVCQAKIFSIPFLHLYFNMLSVCLTLKSTLLGAAPYKPMFGLLLTSPPRGSCLSKCRARLIFKSQKSAGRMIRTFSGRYSKSSLVVIKMVAVC